MFGLFKTEKIQEINVVELKKQLSSAKPPILLDVRTKEEFNSGIIGKKVKHASVSDFNFSKEVEKLDKSATYVVYCRSGNRSAAACKMMMKMGFKDVSNLVGGIIAWNQLNR
jgi:rhodanese-related sulfurtransferase